MRDASRKRGCPANIPRPCFNRYCDAVVLLPQASQEGEREGDREREIERGRKRGEEKKGEGGRESRERR